MNTKHYNILYFRKEIKKTEVKFSQKLLSKLPSVSELKQYVAICICGNYNSLNKYFSFTLYPAHSRVGIGNLM